MALTWPSSDTTTRVFSERSREAGGNSSLSRLACAKGHKNHSHLMAKRLPKQAPSKPCKKLALTRPASAPSRFAVPWHGRHRTSALRASQGGASSTSCKKAARSVAGSSGRGRACPTSACSIQLAGGGAFKTSSGGVSWLALEHL